MRSLKVSTININVYVVKNFLSILEPEIDESGLKDPTDPNSNADRRCLSAYRRFPAFVMQGAITLLKHYISECNAFPTGDDSRKRVAEWIASVQKREIEEANGALDDESELFYLQNDRFWSLLSKGSSSLMEWYQRYVSTTSITFIDSLSRCSIMSPYFVQLLQDMQRRMQHHGGAYSIQNQARSHRKKWRTIQWNV